MFVGSVSAQTTLAVSAGPCSPPILENSGNITFHCEGISDEAVKFLADRLVVAFAEQIASATEPSDLESQLKVEIDEWSTRYHALEAQLSDQDNTEAAQALIQAGRLDEAETLLSALSESQRPDLELAAKAENSLGELALLRFDDDDAILHFRRAHQLDPSVAEYALSFAKSSVDLGDLEQAEEALIAAEELRRQEALTIPSPDASVALAEVVSNLSALYLRLSDIKMAMTKGKEALDLVRVASAQNNAHNLELTGVLVDIANVYEALGEDASQEAALLEAEKLVETLTDEDIAKFPAVRQIVLNNLSNLYADTDRLDLAADVLQSAIPALRTLAQTSSEHTAILAVVLCNLGLHQAKRGDAAAAISHYDEALGLIEDLIAQRPASYALMRAWVISNYAEALLALGKHQEADAAYGQSIEIIRGLHSRSHALYRRPLADALLQHAEDVLSGHLSGDAKGDVEEALTLFRELATVSPQLFEPRVARSLQLLADLSRQAGDDASTEFYLKQAVALAEGFDEFDPPRHIDALIAKRALARFYGNSGREDLAVEMYEDILSVGRELVRIDSTIASRFDLTWTLREQARIFARRRDNASAERNLTEAVNILDQVKAERASHVPDAASLRIEVGDFFRSVGQLNNAISNYQSAIDLLNGEANPTVGIREMRVEARLGLAHCYRQSGELGAVETQLLQARAEQENLPKDDVGAGQMAYILGELGALHEWQDRSIDAAEMFEAALVLYRSMAPEALDRAKPRYAWVARRLAESADAHGEISRAENYYALAVSVSKGLHEQDGEAFAEVYLQNVWAYGEFLTSRAFEAEMDDRNSEARVLYSKALTVFSDITSFDPSAVSEINFIASALGDIPP